MRLFSNFIKNNLYILLPFTLILYAYVFTGIEGEFPINDDWIFKRQIDAFYFGNHVLSELIDPSFLAQGFLGYIWSLVFGTGFTALRGLTVLFYFMFLIGFSRILKMFDITRSLALVSMLTLAFNPLIYFSSYTFMTEIYFLAFATWAMYFFIQYFGSREDKYLLWALLFSAVSVLIRQIGLALFVTYILVEIYPFFRFTREKLVKVFLALLLGAVVFLLWYFWPRFTEPESRGLLDVLLAPENIRDRLSNVWMTFIYLGYFLLPLSYFYLLNDWRQKIRSIIVIILFSLPIAYQVYKYDIFPIGNVLYIENFLIKSDYSWNLSIFDNIPFRALVALLTSISFVTYAKVLFYDILIKRETLLSGAYLFFLFTASASLFASVFILSDFYDRYLLPGFIPLLIVFILLVKETVYKPKFRTVTTLIAVLYIFISIALTYEFITPTRIEWELARELQETTDYRSQIFLDGTYAKYTSALENNDYTGLYSEEPVGNYACFVQKYTMNTDYPLLEVSQNIDNYLHENILVKPRAYDSSKKAEIPKIKENFDKVLTNIEYPSILYNPLGKRAYVGSWCLNGTD